MSVSGHPVPETGAGFFGLLPLPAKKSSQPVTRFFTAGFLLFAVLFLLFSG